MILVQKINFEWRQNFALIKRSKMPPLVDSPAKPLRMRSRFSALSLVHFQVRVGVLNCQQILTKISFVIFCAEMLQQISRMQKRLLISCVFLQHKHSEVLNCENQNRQGVLITRSSKSKSLFKLIKESVIVTLLIVSALFTYFQRSF